MIEELITLAKTQIGVAENPPGSNSVIYNQQYYGSDVRQPWCVVFIWWLFNELGIGTNFCGGLKTAYCPYVENFARNNGQWVTSGYKPGDLVLYDWDGDGTADHIGLIIGVNGNVLNTIEGNCSDCVSEMFRSTGSVRGAYRPAYPEHSASPKLQPEPEKEEGLPGQYTVKKGDTLWGIAERMLGSGDRYIQIMSANNMVSTTIHPGEILVIPNGNTTYKTIQITITSDTYELLTIMADGWNKTIGQCIDALCEDSI